MCTIRNIKYIDFYNLLVDENNITKIIKTPDYYNYKSFIRNTSIATSTMIIKKNIIDNVFFPLLKLCEDYYFKCQILKRTDAYKCPSVFSYYRIRENSLQSNRSKIFFAIWNINKYFNKMNFINNLISIFFISYNSLKKYGFR